MRQQEQKLMLTAEN